MRFSNHTASTAYSLCLFSALALCYPSTALAQRGGKGGGNGGGGDDGGGSDPTAPVQYQVEVFQAPGSFQFSRIYDANSRLQTVGYMVGDDGVRGFLYNPSIPGGEATVLNTIVTGFDKSLYSIRQARAINEAGDIAAYLEPNATPGEFLQAIMIDMNDAGTAGVCHIIPDSEICDYSVAEDINDLGDIVVVYDRADGTRGVYYHNFGLTDPSLATEAPVDFGAVNSRSRIRVNNLRDVVFTEFLTTVIRLNLDSGDVEWLSELGGASVLGLNELGTFCGSTFIETGKGKNKGVDVAYIYGSELVTYSDFNGPHALNLTSDFVSGDNLYHQTHGRLSPVNLLDSSDSNNSRFLSNYFFGLYELTDRDSETDFPVLIGIGGPYTSNESEGFILTPQKPSP